MEEIMFIIDRFEEDWVVLEFDRKTFQLPRQLVPPEAREGDVILIKVSVDVDATSKLKEEIDILANRLFKE